MTKITKYGENGLQKRIAHKFGINNNSTVIGIGNDASVIDNGDSYTLASTDLLIEGIHFNLTYFPLKHLGYKAVIRAISDIYAMNGTASQLLVGIGISSRFQVEAIDELFEGINLGCEKYGIDLVGGDTSGSLTGMTISVTAIGSVSRDKLITRGKAKPNDLICVTGDLGAAYMGLQILERERVLFEKNNEIQPDLEGTDYVIGRQLRPDLPLEIMKNLSKSGLKPTSMIDVTNGLASDIMQLCESSSTGCRIFPERIPVDHETSGFAEEFKLDPLLPALNGGDDFEMLFTLPVESHEKLSQINGTTIIGHMVGRDEGLYLIGDSGTSVEITAPGW